MWITQEVRMKSGMGLKYIYTLKGHLVKCREHSQKPSYRRQGVISETACKGPRIMQAWSWTTNSTVVPVPCTQLITICRMLYLFVIYCMSPPTRTVFLNLRVTTPLGVEWPFHKGHLKPLENTDTYITVHNSNKWQLWNTNEVILWLGSSHHEELY